MNEPVSFLQLFTAPSFQPALIRKLAGAVVTKGHVDLDCPRIWLCIHVENPLTEIDRQTLRESIRKFYGFIEVELEFENREEVSMRLNINSGIVYRAQKVVIYGPEGIGKSTLASKFPEPLFIDTEEGTAHMDVRRTDPPGTWTMLVEMITAVRDTPGICRTLVLDTADWAEMLCSKYVTSNAQVDSIESFAYGKGYVYLQEEFARLLNLLNEVVARGIHVVITAHAKMRKFEQPDEMGAYDRWEMKLSKQVAPLLKEWCDLLLFANYKTLVVATDIDKKGKARNHKAQGGKRVMYTSHHACWDAKNRMNLPEELPLEYAPLAQYFDPVPAPNTNPAPASAPAPASIPASASVQSPAPAQASVSAPPPNQNVADRDMYFYHAESCTYWMLHKGEPFPAGIDTSEEISKEQFETGLAQGNEPYRNPIPDPTNSFDPAPRVAPETGELKPEAEPPAVGSGLVQGVTAVNADPTVGRSQNGTYIDSGGQPLKKALQDFYPLMEMDGITAREVQAVIAKRGYFPADTPLANLPDDFIQGVLIGAWGQVKAVIAEMRADSDLPFTFGKEG